MTKLPDIDGGTLLSAVAQIIASGINRGNFMAMNCQDLPGGEQNWGYNIAFFYGEYPAVIAYRSFGGYGDSGLFIRMLSITDDAWVWSGNWAQLATATKPEEHALPLTEGWSAGRKTKFSVSQNSLVLVTFGVWGPKNAPGYAVIAQLPPGFRPGEVVSTGCMVTDESISARYAAGLDINPAGEIIVFSEQPGWSVAVGQVAFYAD